MVFENTFQLDAVVLLIAFAGFFWRLDRKIEDLRKYVDGKFKDVDDKLEEVNKRISALETALREEIQASELRMREEIKAVELGQREETKRVELAARGDLEKAVASLRGEIQFVGSKVDRTNQRLARLEGMLSVREADVEFETDNLPVA